MEQDIYAGIDENYSTPPLGGVGSDRAGFSLVKELSPQEHLKEEMAWLQGKVWSSKTKTFEKVEGVSEFMNQDGRDMFFQYLTAVLNPIVTMSNFRADTKLIHSIVMMIVKDASIHFHLHWKDYGIKKKTQINVLTTKLMSVGLASLYKALGAGDRKAATSHISESINTVSRPITQEQQQKQGGGFLSKMNPFGR